MTWLWSRSSRGIQWIAPRPATGPPDCCPDWDSEELFDAYPATFSGGEQQRVNIARAVGWQPRLLLLDEPTASLDRQSIERVLDLLRDLRNAGTTMIGIFHDQSIMQETANDIYYL